MTLTHEALHCVSVGFVRNDYEQAPGWEEGVVEQMQRLLRPQVLAWLSASVPLWVIAVADASHSFNPYIAALENIREVPQAENLPFYLRLLRTPIRDRIGVVRVFAKSNATLKENLQ